MCEHVFVSVSVSVSLFDVHFMTMLFLNGCQFNYSISFLHTLCVAFRFHFFSVWLADGLAGLDFLENQRGEKSIDFLNKFIMEFLKNLKM